METVFDERLPKAQICWMHWQWFWFRQLVGAIGMERRYWPRFWMTTRGANYWNGWLGPIEFGWRRPWLRGPAEAHLKQFYGQTPNAELTGAPQPYRGASSEQSERG